MARQRTCEARPDSAGPRWGKRIPFGAIALCFLAWSASDAATESASVRIRLEVARVRVGGRGLSLATLITPASPSAAERAGDARGQRIALPEIRAEGSRFFLRGTAGDIELTPLASAESGNTSAELAYRLASAKAPSGKAAATAATPAVARKVGSGDGTEWTLVGPEGLERRMRVDGPGAPRWRVAAVRDPESGETATVEHDAEGRLSRIVTSAGIEWRFDYQRPSRTAAAELAQITARTTASMGAEMLYRARFEYDESASPTPRLSRVMAASRVPAGVTELSFVYGADSAAGDAAERLREIRTPRGEIDPRFEYDEMGALFVVSAVPAEDAYGIRYPLTTRLAPEYVGEDILEDSLGRRTLAFDAAGRERFRLKIEDGRLHQADGTPLDTGGAPFLIVLAPDGELYAGRGDYSSDAKLHHSSFLAGEEVAAAGEVVVRAGKVVRVTARSGHYKPPMCLLDQLGAELLRRGVKLDDVPFEKGY